MKNDLLILFTNGGWNIIHGVTAYGINEYGMYYFENDDAIGFVPASVVRYFGDKAMWWPDEVENNKNENM